MEPEMKRKLLGELYEIRYEPHHAVGAPVFIRDQVHYWHEDTRSLRHTVFGSGSREALSVVFPDRKFFLPPLKDLVTKRQETLYKNQRELASIS